MAMTKTKNSGEKGLVAPEWTNMLKFKHLINDWIVSAALDNSFSGGLVTQTNWQLVWFLLKWRLYFSILPKQA